MLVADPDCRWAAREALLISAVSKVLDRFLQRARTRPGPVSCTRPCLGQRAQRHVVPVQTGLAIATGPRCLDEEALQNPRRSSAGTAWVPCRLLFGPVLDFRDKSSRQSEHCCKCEVLFAPGGH